MTHAACIQNRGMDSEQDSSPVVEEQKPPPLWNQPEQDLANGNMQVDDVSYIPAEMKRHLDFIDIKQGKHYWEIRCI